MPTLNLENIILLAILLLTTALYLWEHRKNQKLSKILELEPEAITKSTESQSYKIIHDAIRKAQAILGSAETESIKLVADSRTTSENLQKKYAEEIEKYKNQLQASLQEQVSVSQSEFNKFLDDLKSHSEQSQTLNQQVTEQRTREIFELFEQRLATFLTQTEQESISAVDLEIKAARQLIDTYKSQQLALIDENIIAVLERTLAIVLNKKLPLKDQMDLVFEALEKAKTEKFVI
ncbi:hypothetical protein M1563_05295 [Patescibacteria group bacterium]|nr:hypothetical protein [Patescibacteria group bacterium]MCL5409307.1 hypothetical protein [Patescibacteria group bacterium]